MDGNFYPVQAEIITSLKMMLMQQTQFEMFARTMAYLTKQGKNAICLAHSNHPFILSYIARCGNEDNFNKNSRY